MQLIIHKFRFIIESNSLIVLHIIILLLYELKLSGDYIFVLYFRYRRSSIKQIGFIL